MIAVICAHNPGKRNLGMYSVDLSAQTFFSAHRQRFDLIKFTGHRWIGSLRYRIITSFAELEAYDTIVFWGDFQQNPVWGLKNFGPRYARKNRITDAEGFLRWKQLCLLKDHTLKPSQKIFSVGTCFLGAREALKDQADVSEYTRLLARFHAIVPRDSGSFAGLQTLGMTNLVQGFDCATLVGHDAAPAVSAPCFGYAFGRTFTPEQGKRMAQRLEKLTGYRAIPIRWLLKKHGLKFCGFRFAKAIQVIRSVRCVVTDIYHLAVNTLNLNRELVCVGLGNHEFHDTCDDYKKQILFGMAGLENRYVEIPADTGDRVSLVATRVAPFLDQKSATNFDTFNRLRNDFQEQLRLRCPGLS